MVALRNVNINSHEQHPFHLVDPSPWPILTSISAFSLVLSVANYFNYFEHAWESLLVALACFIYTLSRWFSDIITEATFEGFHTWAVQNNILQGMLLFIVSEVMFFFSFFWTYFHFMFSPSIFLGGTWPPVVPKQTFEHGIFLIRDYYSIPAYPTLLPDFISWEPEYKYRFIVLLAHHHKINWIFSHSSLQFLSKWFYDLIPLWDPIFLNGGPSLDFIPPVWYSIPLLNTMLLLTSGATLTWAHKCIVVRKATGAKHTLATTIILGLIFTALQGYEYANATFSINDSAYGSIFYMTTGFHGIHVLIGTAFLIVCLRRLQLGHFARGHHVGFTCAAWYWHFVDVVWIFLFFVVYVFVDDDVIDFIKWLHIELGRDLAPMLDRIKQLINFVFYHIIQFLSR